MEWWLSNRFDPRAVRLADHHYSRRKVGSPQFVPPGSCLVLLTREANAVWVTTAPLAQYVRHAWAGAWQCSCFRNESGGAYRSSDLITEAVAATLWHYGTPPALGMITFVNTRYTASPNPGYCYKRAGWRQVGRTQSGLVALQLLPADMPAPAPAGGAQLALWA